MHGLPELAKRYSSTVTALPGCSSVSIELTHQRLYSARSRRRASRGANGGDGDDGPLGSARLAVRRGRRRHLQAGTCKRHIPSDNSAQQAVPSPTTTPKIRAGPDRRPRASATPQARRKSRGVGRNRSPPRRHLHARAPGSRARRRRRWAGTGTGSHGFAFSGPAQGQVLGMSARPDHDSESGPAAALLAARGTGSSLAADGGAGPAARAQPDCG